MRYFLIILSISMVFTACQTVQTQSNSININVVNSATPANKGVEIGYGRFTKSDKQYIGCWRSVKAAEVVDFKLKFFRFNEKSVQSSEMSKSVAFEDVNSNEYKDYFVFRLKKNGDLQQFLSINLVDNDEMTVGEFKTQKDINVGEPIEYWDLKRESCEKISSKFRK